MRLEDAEDRCPLACADDKISPYVALSGIFTYQRRTANIIVDDRLQHGPDGAKHMDLATDPSRSHRRRTNPDLAVDAMWKIKHERVRLLIETAGGHQHLVEIGLFIISFKRGPIHP